MMRLVSLGSGSSGNGFLLDTGNAAMLIDCGVGVRTIQAALRDFDVHDRLSAIIVSHEHIDHIRSVDSIARRTGSPIVTTRGTFQAIRSERPFSPRSAGERFAEAGVEIRFVSVSHDAAEPCGFVIDDGKTRIAIFTDLGYVGESVVDAIRDADIIVLESNYDRRMLRSGPYPARLKRRIESPTGHLSNDDCAAALVSLTTARTRAIWLAHLSDKNNSAAIALASAREAIALAGYATPVGVLDRFERTDVTSLPAIQLSLGMGV
ncbi:MAG TPA: MBL fold metallo-hydrolase [Thermomicrobiales bacterium]|nr:MBL fold metallo-hydrolase [Thermomicrobiales bacterium]